MNDIFILNLFVFIIMNFYKFIFLSKTKSNKQLNILKIGFFLNIIIKTVKYLNKNVEI
jgi:hypothetical protein